MLTLISKRHNVYRIYRVFELKICQIKGIYMFIGNGNLTVDPWMWLKITSLSFKASVLKDVQNLKFSAVRPNEPNPNWPEFLTLRIALASVFGFFWQKLLHICISKDFSIEHLFL